MKYIYIFIALFFMQFNINAQKLDLSEIDLKSLKKLDYKYSMFYEYEYNYYFDDNPQNYTGSVIITNYIADKDKKASKGIIVLHQLVSDYPIYGSNVEHFKLAYIADNDIDKYINTKIFKFKIKSFKDAGFNIIVSNNIKDIPLIIDKKLQEEIISNGIIGIIDDALFS